MKYTGPERRVHCVYVTRNTEYHLEENVCVAVRDLLDGSSWCPEHPAIGRILEGSLRYQKGGVIPLADFPRVGDAIYFRRGERDLVTSRVQRIERPERSLVAQYPRRNRA
jgi:hypothetical protein